MVRFYSIFSQCFFSVCLPTVHFPSPKFIKFWLHGTHFQARTRPIKLMGGGLAPSSQTVESLSRTPWPFCQPEIWICPAPDLSKWDTTCIFILFFHRAFSRCDFTVNFNTAFSQCASTVHFYIAQVHQILTLSNSFSGKDKANKTNGGWWSNSI